MRHPSKVSFARSTKPDSARACIPARMSRISHGDAGGIRSKAYPTHISCANVLPNGSFGSTRAIGPSRHREGTPGAGVWRRQRMLAVVSPTSSRSPNIAPGSPNHSSSRIVSGCSMRGSNGDHRQPIRRQRSGAWSDRQPLQHPWRQIGQPQGWANEELGDAPGDRGASDRCDIPAIQPQPPVPGARRRPPYQSPPAVVGASECHSDVAVLLLPWMGNGYSPVYDAAARHRAFRGNEHATMMHPFSKCRWITRAPLPRPYT